MIESLVQNKIVTSLNGLLDLPFDEHTMDKIEKLPAFGKSKTTTLKNQIIASSKTDLVKVIVGLDFGSVGFEKAQDIARAVKEHCGNCTIDSFLKFIDEGKISNVSSFGTNTAKEFVARVKTMNSIILALKEQVSIEQTTDIKKSSALEGMSFCFTGDLNSMGRDAVEKLVEEHGGKISGVSKKLTYLVTNHPDKMSGKMKKALELKIPIIDEAKFLTMIPTNNENAEAEANAQEASIDDVVDVFLF
jgi:DNA ligase (NAD+)